MVIHKYGVDWMTTRIWKRSRDERRTVRRFRLLRYSDSSWNIFPSSLAKLTWAVIKAFISCAISMVRESGEFGEDIAMVVRRVLRLLFEVSLISADGKTEFDVSVF